MQLFGNPFGPLESPVRDQNPAGPVVHEMAGRQLGHLAGPDEENRLALEIAEYLPRQLNCSKADGYGVIGDCRFRPHPLGRPECRVQDLV